MCIYGLGSYLPFVSYLAQRPFFRDFGACCLQVIYEKFGKSCLKAWGTVKQRLNLVEDNSLAEFEARRLKTAWFGPIDDKGCVCNRCFCLFSPDNVDKFATHFCTHAVSDRKLIPVDGKEVEDHASKLYDKLNVDQRQSVDDIVRLDRNIFLTGGAGVGKTTVLQVA
jgi:hypothetical protein